MIELNIVLLGAAFGFLIYCSGVGAGVIVVPCLIFLLGLEPLEAVASGSAFSVIAKIAISGGHLAGRNIRMDLFWRYLLFSAPLALLVPIGMGLLGKHSIDQINNITRWILLAAGTIGFLSLLWKHFANWIGQFGLPPIAIATGALVGCTGVGGGVLVVPTLLNAAKVSIKVAVATSIPVGLALSGLVSIGLGAQGLIHWNKVIALSLGATAALPLVVPLFKRTPERVIHWLVIMLIGVTLLALLKEALIESICSLVYCTL